MMARASKHKQKESIPQGFPELRLQQRVVWVELSNEKQSQEPHLDQRGPLAVPRGKGTHSLLGPEAGQQGGRCSVQH